MVIAGLPVFLSPIEMNNGGASEFLVNGHIVLHGSVSF